MSNSKQEDLETHARLFCLDTMVHKMVLEKNRNAAAFADLLQGIVDGTYFLRRVNMSLTIQIPSTDGTKTLAFAADVFPNGIKGVVERGQCPPTEPMVVHTYEVYVPGTVSDFFHSFSTGFSQLYLTEHQIRAFCRTYPGLMRRNTFFLYRGENGTISVAKADPTSLEGIDKFNNKYRWTNGLVVIPAR